MDVQEQERTAISPKYKAEEREKGMALLSYLLGGTTFGLAARIWQLGIQKRNIFDSQPSRSLSLVYYSCSMQS